MADEKRAPYNEAAQPPIAHLAEAMVVGSTDFVYDQEARGQQTFVNSTTLPTDMAGGENDKAALESVGVKFLGVVEGDDMFQYVELPEGWKLQPTNHSMWSDLLDDKGRKRAAIFYKAAFYDRSARLNLSVRYSCRRDYDKQDKDNIAVASVYDGEETLFTTDPVQLPSEKDLAYYDAADSADKAAYAWLDEHFPDWKSPAAYWD